MDYPQHLLKWRIVRQTKSSSLKRLWVFERGMWQPTDRYAWDGVAMPIIGGGAPGTVDKTIAASGDDGGVWTEDGGFSTTDTNAYLGCHIGLFGQGFDFFRFVGITLEGIITTSYMRFYGFSGPTGSPELRIRAVDEDNPDAPTTEEEFNADPLTENYKDWTSDFGSGWRQTPSLNNVIQELVDSYTIEDDAIMLRVDDIKNSGTNKWNISLWDPDGLTNPPELHIEWEVAPPVPPRPPGYGLDPMIF